MEHFPHGIKFKYPWRKYQARILSELDQHLGDDHLHLVAPPGSGKTVLGLEIMLRINKPTLIVAPTLAIRNQWINRFSELFLSPLEKTAWISRDIHHPQFLTVSTYQALHAASRDKKDANQLIAQLQQVGVKTIIVDEAHHLQNAWWQSLNFIKKALQPTVVGLTATPPYDVSRAEWQRYIDLNGPVDAEITVPELVREGDLCPHQDFILASTPTEKEQQKIFQYYQRLTSLCREIQQDATLIAAMEQHPFHVAPFEHLDSIYADIQRYSAMLIFLHHAGIRISRQHLEVVGDKELKLPRLSPEWLEILLSFYLFNDNDHFTPFDTHRRELEHKLAQAGVIENRVLNFRHNKKINKLLSASITKLNSILNIVNFEYVQLGDDLRMVILTDYIRREYFVNQPDNRMPLNKIGVIPIFEQLRRNASSDIRLGVLSGSLVILPVLAADAFRRLTTVHVLEGITLTPLAYDSRYLAISATDKSRHSLVHIVTELFQQGQVEVLIGTKALLGEGWDAPAINSLILASFVGSYVQSNQMRGRAMRVDKLNESKTSNIWHLICVEPTTFDGGDDIQSLKRRFKTFVGVSILGEERIENGIQRVGLPPRQTGSEIHAYNQTMFEHAARRAELGERWRSAVQRGRSLVEEYKIPFPSGEDYKRNRRLSYRKTIASFLAALASGLAAYANFILEWLAKNLRLVRTLDDLVPVLITAGGVGVILFGGQFYKAIRLSLKYRDISKDVEKIGQALLITLRQIGIVHTPEDKANAVAEVDDCGNIYSFLDGGTTYERSIYLKSLQEIIGPINNPRYLLIRKSFLLKLIFQRDYHSVPELIGCKKKYAEFLRTSWEDKVGRCELVYTRTVEGRKTLLRSRLHSLASEFQEETERISKWR